jgi:hypothetical protein
MLAINLKLASDFDKPKFWMFQLKTLVVAKTECEKIKRRNRILDIDQKLIKNEF